MNTNTNTSIFILIFVKIILFSRKYYHSTAFFKTFPSIYNMSSLIKTFSLTYTTFKVSDGNSFNPRFRKCFH